MIGRHTVPSRNAQHSRRVAPCVGRQAIDHEIRLEEEKVRLPGVGEEAGLETRRRRGRLPHMDQQAVAAPLQ
jgi:hypothetical protein